MMQPFEIFEQRYLDRLLKMKRHFVVTQTYRRATDHFAEYQPTDLLLTDYDDEGAALIHFNAVRKLDKLGAIINLSKPAHITKLKEMMEGEKYRLYWCVVKSLTGLQKKVDAGYKDKARRFISNNTDWRIKGDETIKSTLEVIFGEIFITFKWKTKKLRVKFQDIEKA
ncbi:DUF1173 domain-containing protein [Sediminibacterium roseum]|uniref:DUF1173 domain-containing protein n=1 Tax=Sediminibacterium roseum TaxID=1978412 RepID=A0ABW9ZW63_9BACT|nr:DUF1173 domain-containing protein [Sediminibacterium roseum]NCI51371.1 DUF1173 domain-containing protein [Sediminibacterium roseum]